MRQRIEQTWHRIEESVPGTRFNFDFWQQCTPYRSTYPSCRAVIAAAMQGAQYDRAMTRAIQHAYYQQARNPSETATLVALAAELGLDVERFTEALRSGEVEQRLQQQLQLASSIGADSYPSLILASGKSHWPVSIDYNDPAPMLDTLLFLLEEAQG